MYKTVAGAKLTKRRVKDRATRGRHARAALKIADVAAVNPDR
jgi:hypothetical protein